MSNALRAFKFVFGEGDTSAWLMNYGRYADTSTIEVFIGTAERAQERAAALTAERAKDREPSDLIEVTPVSVSIFVDWP